MKDYEYKGQRRRKKDKQKDTFNKYGKYTSKHVRMNQRSYNNQSTVTRHQNTMKIKIKNSAADSEVCGVFDYKCVGFLITSSPTSSFVIQKVI